MYPTFYYQEKSGSTSDEDLLTCVCPTFSQF